MIFSAALAFLLASVPALAQQAAIVYTPIHNATAITGTWASGSQKVLTGPGFANPANLTFNYPPVTGVSYSFTEDGYYESARYRMTANGSEPACITGSLVWTHGTFTLNSNGSITMTPFGDGFQQVQAPCAAVSSFVQLYDYVETSLSWSIVNDVALGYVLQMTLSDGSPLPLQSLYSATPNMLPTEPLQNSSVSSLVGQGALVVNGGERPSAWGVGSVGGLVLMLAAMAAPIFI